MDESTRANSSRERKVVELRDYFHDLYQKTVKIKREAEREVIELSDDESTDQFRDAYQKAMKNKKETEGDIIVLDDDSTDSQTEKTTEQAKRARKSAHEDAWRAEQAEKCLETTREILDEMKKDALGKKIEELSSNDAREPAKCKMQQIHPLIHETGDPINILQMCCSETPYSIPLDDALFMVCDALDECGDAKYRNHCYAFPDMHVLYCEVCGIEVSMYSIFVHFFSDDHIEKVGSHGASVSLDAVNFWVHGLQQLAANKDSTTAAAAAAVGNGRSDDASRSEKKREK